MPARFTRAFSGAELGLVAGGLLCLLACSGPASSRGEPEPTGGEGGSGVGAPSGRGGGSASGGSTGVGMGGAPGAGGAASGGSGGAASGGASGTGESGAGGASRADAAPASGSGGVRGAADANVPTPPAGAPDARAGVGLPPIAPATDGGVGGPSRCAAADVLLCEGFESGLASATWRTTRSGGTVAVETMQAARGGRALHITSANGGMNAITQTKTFPIAGNSLFFRMFLWLEDDITTNGHFTFAEARGTGNSSLVRFGGIGKRVGVGSDGGPSGDWTNTDSKATLPSKRWICYESQFDGATNKFRVWIDDKESTTLNVGIDKHPGFVMPMFTSLWFGWILYQQGEAQDLWIDEIAVDGKRIGCAK